MKILITGSAGFIGAALSLRRLQRGDEVIGYDNLNDYYDVTLKQARLARLQGRSLVNHGGIWLPELSKCQVERVQTERER